MSVTVTVTVTVTDYPVYALYSMRSVLLSVIGGPAKGHGHGHGKSIFATSSSAVTTLLEWCGVIV